MVVDDKTEVREYFNNEGFNRWNKIYSESDDVNVVQKVPLACYNACVTFAHKRIESKCEHLASKHEGSWADSSRLCACDLSLYIRTDYFHALTASM